MNENTPILVAPRPVRIASEPGASSYAIRSGTPYRLVSAVADHFERARISGDIDIDEQKASILVESSSLDRDLASTRSSPRSSLPSEALEEFLSILNPSSFFPSSSPILRARRNGASLPNYPYQYRARVLHSRGDSVSLVEEIDRGRSSASTRSPECQIERDEAAGDHERHDSDTFRWFATSALSSPISRMHTRNPFPVGLLRTTQSTPSPISPRAVPLPSPTPDEMIEVS
jgi:hypothetical protein